ncbi:GAF domain-containing sensor histidine kinase [Macrococcus sp. DPC7161]|uniref:GAF domain-containing sensor histidine kinase n=1 Tax=Macrococcus sp. DPC7161 TaxID=2507060 RepID=UPI00100A78E1|nr:GAF domain-containing sensor histidine kinase [Macrococcus sp. DPC7161]RXK17327.1 GAF domain-containing sensor histidine kinase [Macrococcus sp. DPC7161]
MHKQNSTKLLKEIAEYLNEETELYSMMDGALKKLVEGTSFSTGWIFFIDDSGKHTLVSDYKLPSALTKRDCHYMTHGPCWCVSRYSQKKLTKASNIITCSRIVNASKQYEDETDNITHHATVPLVSGDERFGLLNVATPNTKVYSEEDLALLESIAFQIGSAIKRIYLTDKEKETLLQEERNRLARDLHDSVNQMLFSLKLTAHAAKQMTHEDNAKAAFDLIETTSQNAVNEMRSLIWQLKPMGLEQGFVEAIKQYASTIHLIPEIEVQGFIQLTNEQETTLFRMMQELLNNVHKHTDQKDVKIILSDDENKFKMVVIDYGQGFHVQSAKRLPTHGLMNLISRAKSIHAHIDFDSQIGIGTTVTVEMEKH